MVARLGAFGIHQLVVVAELSDIIDANAGAHENIVERRLERYVWGVEWGVWSMEYGVGSEVGSVECGVWSGE